MCEAGKHSYLDIAQMTDEDFENLSVQVDPGHRPTIRYFAHLFAFAENLSRVFENWDEMDQEQRQARFNLCRTSFDFLRQKIEAHKEDIEAHFQEFKDFLQERKGDLLSGIAKLPMVHYGEVGVYKSMQKVIDASIRTAQGFSVGGFYAALNFMDTLLERGEYPFTMVSNSSGTVTTNSSSRSGGSRSSNQQRTDMFILVYLVDKENREVGPGDPVFSVNGQDNMGCFKVDNSGVYAVYIPSVLSDGNQYYCTIGVFVDNFKGVTCILKIDDKYNGVPYNSAAYDRPVQGESLSDIEAKPGYLGKYQIRMVRSYEDVGQVLLMLCILFLGLVLQVFFAAVIGMQTTLAEFAATQEGKILIKIGCFLAKSAFSSYQYVQFAEYAEESGKCFGADCMEI